MMPFLNWWARTRWLPPRANYEFPCASQPPTLTVERYASNEYRNAVAVLELVVLAILALIAVYALSGIRLLLMAGAVLSLTVLVGVALLPLLFVSYRIRLKRLAKDYLALCGEAASLDQQRAVATQLIRDDLKRRRFVVRPTDATADEGDSTLITLPYLPSTMYSPRVWGPYFDPHA